MLGFNTIRKKVITLFVAYTLLFLGIIAIGFYFFITTPLYSHAKETITNKADTVSLQINQDLDSLLPTINTLADFAAEYPAKTLLSQITHTLLTSLNNNTFIISGGIWPEPFALDRDQYKSSIFYNANHAGYEPLEDYNHPLAPDYFREPWYAGVKYRGPNIVEWSDPYTDPVTNVSMVTLSKPYYVDDQFRGVVTLDISLKKLSETIQKEQTNFGGQLYIIDRHGHNILGQDAIPDPNALLTTSKSHSGDWQILATYPKDKVDQQAIAIIKKIIFIAVPITLLFLYLLYQAISRWLVKPIEEITHDLTQTKQDVSLKNQFLHAGDEMDIMVHEINKRIRILNQERLNAIRADKVKSTFLASMSHEIRTPMNGVLGLAQLLMKTPLNQEQTQHLNSLYDSGIHMMSILNDILDFSKIEEGKLKIDHYHFNFNDVVGSLVSTYSPLAKEKGLDFTIYSSVPSDIWLFGDKSRIRQILFNLVNNAIKFTAKGEVAIYFDAEYPCHTFAENGFRLFCRVTDTGIGIAPDSIATIFDPFTQADSSTSRTYGGTGLGLAIVKQLVELMHGTIDIDSTVGQGTEVKFDVHMAMGKNQRPLKSLAVGSMIDDLNILIVEDNKVNTVILKTFLSKKGHQVTCVENGQECLDLLEQEAFDVIFMDNHMPVMDGISATMAIKKHPNPRIANTLVFACTADAYKETKDAMLKAGCNFVLTKPLNEPVIFDALNQFSSELQFSKMTRITGKH
ncbi:MAG: ATP-binding protein [Plesiomonas shigelloides]